MEAAEAPWLTWCRALPKAEVHAHLNGSVRDSTIRELAEGKNAEAALVAEEAHRLTAKGSRTLAECFKLFDIIHRLTTEHSVITRITREVIEDFAADNVRYLELRTTPKHKPEVGMSKRSYVEAVLKGMEDYLDRTSCSSNSNMMMNSHPTNERAFEEEKKEKEKLNSITVRLLLSIDRRENAESAMETVILAWELRSRGIVGIDLSGNPCIGQWSTFEPALVWARGRGLAITLHCGEVPNSEEVRAMLAFGPDRVGHVCCLEEEEWSSLLLSNIPVELCLTSNVKTESVASYSSHHFAELYKERHPLLICTDDAGVFATSVSEEYARAAAYFGLTKEQLRDISLQSIDYVFAPDHIKEELRNDFRRLLEIMSSNDDPRFLL